MSEDLNEARPRQRRYSGWRLARASERDEAKGRQEKKEEGRRMKAAPTGLPASSGGGPVGGADDISQTH
jgi:hypothetical protein